ncbi:MAG TPA: DNA alkylation repair protein [Polyangiaceae bacterium]|nr:DNA alkylation repair protein [Polyangiaceae bacterium]
MPARAKAPNSKPSVSHNVEETLAWLERRGSKKNRDGMARYGITAKKAYGVSMATMLGLRKKLGRDHELAIALFRTGWYEARIMASFVAEPERVTPALMDRWARAFDSWAVCDSMCFHLFDRTPHAWRKVHEWARRDEEFVKRASFALIASLTVHDKEAPDSAYLKALPLIEKAASDPRNFVKKAVNWALRSVGKRNAALHAASVAVARRLASSDDAAARWVGKDALRELTGAGVARRLAKLKSAGRG